MNKSEIMKARINRGLGRMGQEDEYFLSQIMTFVELYIQERDGEDEKRQ